MNYLKYLFYGILAACGALILEFLFLILFFPDSNSHGENMLASTPIILGAAFIEECLKYAFIRKVHDETDHKEKILFYSLTLGLGFFLVEFFLNLTGSNFLTKIGNIFLWGVLFLHLSTTGFIGFMFSKFKTKKIIFFLAVFLAAFFIHVSYNLTVLRFF